MISNMPVLSVSEISQNLKNMVENQFAYVHVRGELTEVKRAASGHIYATLKDKDAVLNLIIWRTSAERLQVKPQDGLEVIATGKLTTYPGRSNYQLVADKLEVAGEGALLKIIEDRRKKLAAEGLFDESRKRALPAFPKRIAVITSPTGAVIRDIMHRIAERYPCTIDLWPVLVQGEGAAGQITSALEAIAGAPDKPDLVIVARGGGSLEDLMAFNEESVVRAAANCPVPLISAVGHETDTTLIDWASDRRAPTPTAAAEMATPHRAAIMEVLLDMQKQMARSLQRSAEYSAQKLDQTAFRLGSAIQQIMERKAAKLNILRPQSPRQILEARAQKITMFSQRLTRASTVLLQKKEQHLASLARILKTVSFETTLERGFVLVRDEAGLPLTRAENAKAGQKITLQFAAQKTRAAEIL